MLLIVFVVVGIFLRTANFKSITEIKQDIKIYQETAKDIISLFKGRFRHDAYTRLGTFVDKFGPRPSGSFALEESFDYLSDELHKGHLENVHSEPAMVIHWKRGEESAELLTPRKKTLNVKALGRSIGTPDKGIEASVIVVESFEELQGKEDQIQDKIVVYNQQYKTYSQSKEYRTRGAAEASKYGAVAALVKSVTPFSISSPHVGDQEYEHGIKKIPVASITVEDAEMMQRMQNRGDHMVIKLNLGAKMYADVESRNVIAEIIGYKYPEEVVIISAHVDTWDISEGAMDDGSGIFVAIEALLSLVELNLRPKRTIRAIFWTGEEIELRGAKAYHTTHKKEMENIVLAMEADEGVFKPLGLNFQGTYKAQKIMEGVLNLLSPINATKVRKQTVNYGDMTYIVNDGVPGATLWTADQHKKYFYFHHTEADTMTIIDPDHLDMASALWATVAYVVADMDERLPSLNKIKADKKRKLNKQNTLGNTLDILKLLYTKLKKV